MLPCLATTTSPVMEAEFGLNKKRRGLNVYGDQ